MIKDETWYVDKGKFKYKWIDTETADTIEVNLKPGDIVRQRPGQPHQLIAITDGVIFEVSTHHKDSDSYRVWKGDSQK
jgi:mannose-6-phosphate isomerase-like protein (cupin superfamily)